MLEVLTLLVAVGCAWYLGDKAGRRAAQPEVTFGQPFKILVRGAPVMIGVITDISRGRASKQFSGTDLTSLLERHSVQ